MLTTIEKLKPSVEERAVLLEDFYIRSMGGLAIISSQEHEELWGDVRRFGVTQDGRSGTFEIDGVSVLAGSLPGVTIGIETEQSETFRLRLTGDGRPEFAISALDDEIQVQEEGLFIEPIVKNYQNKDIPVTESFDWEKILAEVFASRNLPVDKPLYLVAFRSQLKEGADVELLEEYDRRAYEVAKRSPALIHYFTGVADDEGWNLSFCLWSDAEEARATMHEPHHQEAMRIAGDMYSEFWLERHPIKVSGEEPYFSFE